MQQFTTRAGAVHGLEARSRELIAGFGMRLACTVVPQAGARTQVHQFTPRATARPIAAARSRITF